MGTLHEDACTYMIRHSIILRMRNVLDKFCRGTETQVLCSITLLKNFAVYEMCKNILQLDRPQMTI